MAVHIFSKGILSLNPLNPPLFPYMVREFDMLCTIKLKQQIVASDRLHTLKVRAHVKKAVVLY